MFWFLLFFLTPIAEMYLLIEVAGYINTLPTVALVMLTAVLGVYLLRLQGVSTLTRGLSRMNQGEMPAQEMAEGLLLAMAGALMITPGFITDTVGFLILAPPTRVYFARLLLKRVQVQGMAAYGAGGPGGGGQGNFGAGASAGRPPGGAPGASSANATGQASQSARFGAAPRGAPPQAGAGETIEGDFERKS